MTNNLEKILVLEGTLLQIKKISYEPMHQWNGVCGPGSSSHVTGYLPKTIVSIKSDKNNTDIAYKGIILPDSIGNKIQIYHEVTIKNKGHRFLEQKIENQDNLIYDTKLERWYE